MRSSVASGDQPPAGGVCGSCFGRLRRHLEGADVLNEVAEFRNVELAPPVGVVLGHRLASRTDVHACERRPPCC